MEQIKVYLRDNKALIAIGLVWVIVGMYAGPLIYLVLPAMLIMMYNRGYDLEILVGFFFILTLSDSRLYSLSFAATAKNIYILFIVLITIKDVRNIKNPIVFYKYFAAFFLFAFICVFFNPNISLSFQKTLSYVLLFTFVPNYFLLMYQKHGVVLFKKLVFMVCTVLVLGLFFNLFMHNVTNLAGRFRGLLGNPNGLGLYTFLFILFFATLNDIFSDLFTKNEKIVIYIIAFYCLLKCGARASLVSVSLFFFFKRFYKFSSILGFVIFVITVFIYQLISENLVEIITSLGLGDTFRVNTLENGSGRTIAWKFAWEQIHNSFYVGNGFNYTEYIYLKNYEYLSMLGHQGAAHNMFLTFWLDTGLIGLLLFIFGLIMLFYNASKYSTIAIPILYSILFSNYYESWLTASLNPFTIQLLFILTLIFIKGTHAVERLKLDTSLKLG